jgi:hypothetical protein
MARAYADLPARAIALAALPALAANCAELSPRVDFAGKVPN